MQNKTSAEIERCLQYAVSQGYQFERSKETVRLIYQSNSVTVDNDDPVAVLLAIKFLRELKSAREGKQL
jgi:TPP-dependent pyruvate/acetoin dehydrogenase alpha subunit